METNAHEAWRDILGYEGRYEVSDQGRVRSIRTIKGMKVRYLKKSHILKIRKCKGGKIYPTYPTVILHKEGKTKNFSVHLLVWEAFNGKRPKGYDIDHINEVKTDNRLCNLQLLTNQENKLKSARINPSKNNKYIYELRLKGTDFFYRTYSCTDLSLKVNIPAHRISCRLYSKPSFEYNGMIISRRLKDAKENDK